ncbi:methyltransferase domain-containing protein [Ruegeria sp. 2012CJ41-6]|uniref:Methyltransferase domain-containing protein n=1 Tax=Ruegeria spongiae TaxID=2942209 RepID=A0ABT0Q1P6_9RHOB|nr:methyltransferase domain-containing protein [Ruegeria spongiae]MCL6282859.1 methyltransferase domain-containing protein [Ruegeria spongiae]
MTRFTEQELSCDAFLGGKLHLFQPLKGYRAGVDPVFLAASVPARPGQAVLELGCGAGAAILSLAARVPDLGLCGVEIQPAYADLARRNAAYNHRALEVVEGDLSTLPANLRERQFDHVLANPPYFRDGAHSPARDAGRRRALGEETPLTLWIDTAARRLISRGYLHMIQRVERLPDMVSACGGRLGSLEVLPLAARTGRPPDLIILRARKGGRADFRLHAPLILHAGDRHERDGESYRPEIQDVLRNGAALRWP